MIAALVGVFAVWKRLGAIVEKNLGFLISLSAGVFLIITYKIGNEVIIHAGVEKGLFWILLGLIGTLFLFKLLPNFHNHENELHLDENHSEHQHIIDFRKILLGDALHNIGDGLFLAVSFATSQTLGIVATISIFIHELVQELSKFFIVRGTGLSFKKTIIVNFLSQSTILIGAIGGYFLFQSLEFLEAPLLGLSAGIFLIVIFQDLIPHSIKSSDSKKHLIKHLIWFLVGVLIMFGVGKIAPDHSHEHEHDIDTHIAENLNK